MNPKLIALHNDIIAVLKSVGAVFDEPQYLEEGYKAHATVRSDANRLHKGDAIIIDEITIVDMFPHGDISQRRTLRTIKFLG